MRFFFAIGLFWSQSNCRHVLAAEIGICICTVQIHRLSRMGILELYVLETRSWNAIIFYYITQARMNSSFLSHHFSLKASCQYLI